MNDFMRYLDSIKKNANKDIDKKEEPKKKENKNIRLKKYSDEEFKDLENNNFLNVDIDRLKAPQLKKFNNYKNREGLLKKLVDTTPDTYKLIDSIEQLKKTMCYIKKHKPILACDTETNGLDVYDSRITGASFGFKQGETLYNFYIPLRHNIGKNIDDKEEAIRLIKEVMEDKDIKKIMHNASYDIPIYKTENITVKGLYMDTLVAFKCLREDLSSYSLKELAKTYLKMEDTVHYEDLFGKNASYAEVNPKYYAYPCRDTDMTYNLYELIESKFNEEGFEKVKSVYYDIEHPLIQVICDMKIQGVALDEERFLKVRDELKESTERLRGELLNEINKILYKSDKFRLESDVNSNESKSVAVKIKQEGFNLNSNQQKVYLFYDILGCTSKDDKQSTDKNFMDAWSKKIPIAKLFKEYTGEEKLFNSFTDSLKEKQSSDGKIRPNFNQFGTVTGRFSSNAPNFQNLPSKRDEIRAMFKADEGYLLLSADYSQIELRVLAHCSKDPNLLEAYNNAQDIHLRTACLVFGHDYEEGDRLNKAMDLGEIKEGHPEYEKAKEIVKHRKYSKTINFGLIYGMTAKGLGDTLGVSKEEAQSFMDKYFEGLPNVLKFMEEQKQTAYKKGYVETLNGRRRRLNKELYSSDKWRRIGAERQAPNAVIQGTAADLLKLAMPKVQAYLRNLDPKAGILIQVHDEIICQIPENITKRQIKDITDIMCNAMQFDIELKSDPEVAKYWTEKIPFSEIPD